MYGFEGTSGQFFELLRPVFFRSRSSLFADAIAGDRASR